MLRLIGLFCLIILFACNSEGEKKKENRWMLSQKTKFDYTLNSLGKIDTAFAKVLTFDSSGNRRDSVLNFTVFEYFKGTDVKQKYFTVGKDKKIVYEYSLSHFFDKGGRVIRIVHEFNDFLINDDRYLYNDSNQLMGRKMIKSKAIATLNDESLHSFQFSPRSIATTFDTTEASYQYDATKKIIATITKSSTGSLLFSDLNLYVGDAPMSTFTLGPKGDTLQRTSYKVAGKTIEAKIENDSFILLQKSNSGFMLSQMTKYKSKNEVWKLSHEYDERGTKVGESLYKMF